MQKDIKGQDFSFILLWKVDVGAFFVPLTQPLYKATKIPASLLRSLQVVWHQNNLQKIFSAPWPKTEKMAKKEQNYLSVWGYSVLVLGLEFQFWISILSLSFLVSPGGLTSELFAKNLLISMIKKLRKGQK